MSRKVVFQVKPGAAPPSIQSAIAQELQKPCHYLVEGSLLSGREAVYRLLAGCREGRTVLLVTKPGEPVSGLLARIEDAEQSGDKHDLLIISDAGNVLGSIVSDQQARQLTDAARRRIWFCRTRSPGARYLTGFWSYERLLRAAEQGCGTGAPPGVDHYAHIPRGARLIYCIRLVFRVIVRNLRQLRSDLSLEVFGGLS
jgi:hypothetical protein